MPRALKPLLVVALIGMVVLLAWWSQREVLAPGAKKVLEAAGAPKAGSSHDALPDPAHADPTTPLDPARGHGEGDEARREVEAPGPEPAVAAEKFGVDVHVIVTDSAGVEHPSEDGWVTPTSVVPIVKGTTFVMQEGWADPAAVVDGRFHTELAAGAKLGVKTITLGGRPAVALATSFDVVPGAVLTVRARWIEAVILRVVDDATGAELGDVTVVEQPEWYGVAVEAIHPGWLKP